MFLEMRPGREETTVAYATRLREKAHDCNFGSNYDERILEHLIKTIENSVLIQKCISKAWTLQEFLMEAQQIEDILTQMQDMKPNQWNKEIHKVEERLWNDWTQQNLDIQHNCILIVDWKKLIQKEGTVQLMEYSARSATSMTISKLFADLMGRNKMKKKSQQGGAKMNR